MLKVCATKRTQIKCKPFFNPSISKNLSYTSLNFKMVWLFFTSQLILFLMFLNNKEITAEEIKNPLLIHMNKEANLKLYA